MYTGKESKNGMIQMVEAGYASSLELQTQRLVVVRKRFYPVKHHRI